MLFIKPRSTGGAISVAKTRRVNSLCLCRTFGFKAALECEEGFGRFECQEYVECSISFRCHG